MQIVKRVDGGKFSRSVLGIVAFGLLGGVGCVSSEQEDEQADVVSSVSHLVAGVDHIFPSHGKVLSTWLALNQFGAGGQVNVSGTVYGSAEEAPIDFEITTGPGPAYFTVGYATDVFTPGPDGSCATFPNATQCYLPFTFHAGSGYRLAFVVQPWGFDGVIIDNQTGELHVIGSIGGDTSNKIIGGAARIFVYNGGHFEDQCIGNLPFDVDVIPMLDDVMASSLSPVLTGRCGTLTPIDGGFKFGEIAQ